MKLFRRRKPESAGVLLGATPGVDIPAAMRKYDRASKSRKKAASRINRALLQIEIDYINKIYYLPEGTTLQQKLHSLRETTQNLLAENMIAQLRADVAEDPVARWILNEVYHRTEALDALRRLPATLEQLDDYAKSRRWCERYDEYRSQAETDGVI